MLNPHQKSIDWSLLEKNLSTLYCAAHFRSKDELPVVPALFGNRLYHTRADWRGRILIWLYKVLKNVPQWQHLQKKRQELVAHKTALVFQEAERLFNDRYPKYLTTSFVISKKGAQEHQRAKRTIAHFYQSAYPYLCLGEANSKKVLNDFFKGAASPLLVNVEVSKNKIEHALDWMEFEALSGGQIPLAPLKAFLEDKKLSAVQGHELERWLHLIVYSKPTLECNYLHRMLQVLIEGLVKEEERELALTKLELQFYKKGYQLFNENDPVFRDTQKSFLSEVKVHFANVAGLSKQLDISNLGCIGWGDCKCLTYQAKDETNQEYLLVLPPNAAYAALHKYNEEKLSWGIRCAEIDFIDPKGRFVVVEGLQALAQGLNPARLERLRFALNALFQQCYSLGLMPPYLEATNLGWSDLGELKSFRGWGLESGEGKKIDGLVLEELLFSIFKSDHACYASILAEIIEKKDPLYRVYKDYFQEVFAKALKGAPMPEAPTSLGSASVKLRAKALFEDVQSMKEKSLLSIMRADPTADLSQIKSFLDQDLNLFYNTTKTLGRLWHTLKSEDLVASWHQRRAMIDP